MNPEPTYDARDSVTLELASKLLPGISIFCILANARHSRRHLSLVVRMDARTGENGNELCLNCGERYSNCQALMILSSTKA